jgi:hypothetical protein
VKVSTAFEVRLDPQGDAVSVLLDLEALPAAGGRPTRVIQDTRLTIHLKPGVEVAEIDEEPAAHVESPGSVVFDLGELSQGEHRELAMTFHIPTTTSIGLIRVAVLELQYAELPAGTQHLITLPIAVEATPGEGRTRIVTPAWAEKSESGWFRVSHPRKGD